MKPKTFWVLAGGLMLIWIFANGGGQAEKSPVPTDTAAASEPARAQTANLEAIKAFDEFAAEYSAIKDASDRLMEVFGAELVALSEGKQDRYQAYLALHSLTGPQKQHQLAVSLLTTPRALPKDAVAALSRARSHLSIAIQARGDALQAAMAFIDDASPKNLAKAHSSLAESVEYMRSSAEHLNTAAALIGRAD